MIRKGLRYLHQIRNLQRMNLSLNRGAAAASLRRLDPARPTTWEFSGFSQQGEDGIIDYLTRQLRSSNQYFVEIGSANGLENNSTWLAVTRSFSGMMVDGNPNNVEWCRFMLTSMNYGLKFRHFFVTLENLKELMNDSVYPNPDVFSLDIDGNDYHIVKGLLELGIRPKIWVLEYNSAFGPERRISVPYRADFEVVNLPDRDLYCGCSIAAWRSLMGRHGYQFVTVDQCGVNAFFIDPKEFPDGFGTALHGLEFRVNRSHARAYGACWEQHFKRIHGQLLVEV